MNTIKNASGVYRIMCTENGKKYYGSSKNLRDRCQTHKSMMRIGTHSNPGIKEDAAIYGEEAFKFTVMFYCKPEERKAFEGVLIDWNYGKDCYNDTKGDGARSEETKQQISEALKGIAFSEDHKNNLSEALKGRAFTEEHKANMRKSKSESHKANLRKPKRKTTCPRCGLTGGTNGMKRWHFDNCKHKPSLLGTKQSLP